MKRREFVGLAAPAIVAPAFAPGVAGASHPDVAGLEIRKAAKWRLSTNRRTRNQMDYRQRAKDSGYRIRVRRTGCRW